MSPTPGRPARTLSPALRFSSAVLLLALVLYFASFSSARAQTPHISGQWAPKQAMGGIAIHLALLPGGTSPYHSRIVWWTSSDTRGMWGWSANTDTCGVWPAANFVSRTFATPPTGMNIFCGGHVALPDGRLFVAGGTETGATGITKAAIFNADDSTWTALNPMTYRRWYPTATVLADGKVFTAGGNKYFHMYAYGGHPKGSSVPSDSALRRFGTPTDGVWDAASLRRLRRAIHGPPRAAAWKPMRAITSRTIIWGAWTRTATTSTTHGHLSGRQTSRAATTSTPGRSSLTATARRRDGATTP